ncbi:MAG: polyribonucleotide nucleotidyltransferase [Christensenellaceae bacterium]|jgi:polyribonucleotide nucleotidyltransferase|nr:polyribonucleotide nucleotidyltransferase [Christensenellaceae bacterium]
MKHMNADKKGTSFETSIGGKKVTVLTGKYAEQSNGSCMISCGETVLLANVCMANKPRDGIDFFPLSVDYEEKMYAVGKIPGGFKKREGRASDKAILTSRLCDRPLRPLFPKGFYNDVTIVITALSVDPAYAPEPLAMLASSVALTISDIPFMGPTGAVSVGLIDGKYIANPTSEQREKSVMHVYVSGTKEAILMVEAAANEVSEKEMLGAIMFAHEEIKNLVDFQQKIQKKVGVKKATDYPIILPASEVFDAVRDYADKRLDKALDNFEREERQKKQSEVEEDVKEHFKDKFDERSLDEVLYKIVKSKVREKILSKGVRPDGRKSTEIRPIWCDVGMLPRVHGSAVFTRGQTQVLTALTLGMMNEVQRLEGLDDEEEKRYVHHYNMPAYATGEARSLKLPGRREIGHGALAERALEPVIPSEEEFPYALRLVSEVLSSNGSSSMASTCGSTLALLDAGVPIKSPVAGIAMGLIKDPKTNKVAILSDIQGLEDFLGDMDFKVTGTTKGITAIQMDIKIAGIDEKILQTALEQARVGRIEILGEMLKVIKVPNKNLNKYAPKIITFNIDPDKIRDVIGSGGKVINKIIEETGVKINIEDDGKVDIASSDEVQLKRAKEIVMGIVEDLEVGKEYDGKVMRIMQFGAFVEVLPTKEGMIHISKLSEEHVAKVTDVVNIGDKVRVKAIKVDEKGRVDFRLVKKL